MFIFSPHSLFLLRTCRPTHWQIFPMRCGKVQWNLTSPLKRSRRLPGACLPGFISSGSEPRWSRTSMSRTSTTSASTTRTIRCGNQKGFNLSSVAGDTLAGEEWYNKPAIQYSWTQGCEHTDQCLGKWRIISADLNNCSKSRLSEIWGTSPTSQCIAMDFHLIIFNRWCSNLEAYTLTPTQ